LGLRIRRFCCDNGRGEYDNTAFKSILATNGITYVPSAPYTQDQNGVSEQKIRTITERAQSMILDAGLTPSFWAEACNRRLSGQMRHPCQMRRLRTFARR